MKTVGIVGAGSMVGSRFCELSKLLVTPGDFPQVDITKKESVSAFFKNPFEYVILLSAYTDVDEAEKQRENKNGQCWQINVAGLTNVVEACLASNKKLLFVSTESVFDGTNGPYAEIESKNQDREKMGWYGLSKLEGENIVANRLEDYMVVRITYPYRGRFKNKSDFAKKILQKYKEGTLYPMFDDQIWTPTFIDDVAPAIDLLITKGKSGIYHIASPNQTTPYQFAQELLTVFGLDPEKVEKGSINQFLKRPGATPRPAKGGLKVDKIVSEGFMPTTWQEGIKEIYKQSKGQLI